MQLDPPEMPVCDPSADCGQNGRENRERATYCFSAFAEVHLVRKRTAKPGNRDKRDQLAAIDPELAVSDLCSAVPLPQDLAKARDFLEGSRPAGAE
jgi:hypothetical protein